MKKIISPLIAALLLLLISGCGSGNENKPIPELPYQKAVPSPAQSHYPGLPTGQIKPNQYTQPTPKLSDIPKIKTLRKIEPIVPTQIWIPSVGIKAPLEPIGLLKNGQLEVPVSSKVAGIYTDGILPGQPGKAIVAGHVDNYTGPAIFYPLKRLKPGHSVIVSDNKGKSLVFKVTSVESYVTAKAPLEQIFGDSDKAELNLITCTGKYNRKKKEHEKRLVVYTRLAGS